MGGSAQGAGLVTRGICGVGQPGSNGSCSKENLYINYDGTNTYSSGRQLILQAGESGDNYGHNLYQFAAARGDAVKGYVDEKIENRVVINDPITITEGDNTTSITSDTISTTTLTGTLDAESMKNSLTAEAIKAVVPIAWDGNNLPSRNGTQSISIGSGAESNGGYAVTIGNGAHGDSYMDVCIGYNSNTQHNYSVVIGGMLSTDGTSYINTRTNAPQSIAIGNGAQILNGTDANGTTVQSSNSVAIGTSVVCNNLDSVVIGANAKSENGVNSNKTAVVVGAKAYATGGGGNVAIGTEAKATGSDTSIGFKATGTGGYSVTVGAKAINNGAQKTTLLGADTTITNTTATDGSITRSENSTVIGYGASASAPNAVVLGAEASTAGAGTILIGAGTNLAAGAGNLSNAILIGRGAKSTGEWASGSICIGYNANIAGDAASAIGSGASAEVAGYALGTNAKAGTYSTAIGFGCVNKNTGTTSIKQTSVDYTTNPRTNYATQFYIMGANSSLAVQYEDGEACMGYVVKNETTGEILAAGTQKLSVLFPNNSTFQPATIDENGEWVMPKVFHPSDLDLPIEEPSENNDVEINIPTIEEEYNPLPIYPLVEPTIDEITE